MAHSRVVFDGYSYEPPSYEECVGNGPLNNQSVYNPTVSHDTNFVGGFRPLYTPNGYNGLSEYNVARRRRRIRICCATFFGVFCLVLLIMIVFTNINRILHGAGRGVSGVNHDYKNNDDLTSYKDSSILNNNDDNYREMANYNKQTEDTNDNVLDKIKDNQYSENTNVFTNDNNWQTDTLKFLERMKPKDNPADSAEEKQSPKNNHYSPFLDLDDLLKKEMDKWNLDKFDDTFANIGKGKHTPSNENPFNFDPQDELSNHKPVSTLEALIKKSEDMKQWMQRLSSSKDPTSTTDKVYMDVSTGKSLDEDVKMPDVSTDSSIANNNDDHERRIANDNKQTDIVLDKLFSQVDDPEMKKVYDIIRPLKTNDKRKILDDTDEIISNHS